MKSWQQAVLDRIFSMKLTIFKWLMTFVLVLSVTSCSEKAGGKEIPVSNTSNPAEISQISAQFSEVSPPAVIQELRPTLENYLPQVTIVTPQPDKILQDNTVTVNFEVKDLPIFKDPQLELGPHLHVILDNQPYIAVYNINQPLVLPDLSPGTHTLRVFASRPWHESFKNEGAYAQTTFHIFTKTDDNNPDPTLPVLTYSRPKGSYGAEPILLDFYLTNAPLHLVAEDNPNDTISDWRIRCTINDESFILDRWQPIYLKGFKPGKNWVKLEFLDNQGNPIKNAFNTTARVINYQPQGEDTLAKIVRGELKADQSLGIVDPDYTAKKEVKKEVIEPTPTPTVEKTPEPQPQLIPETEVTETPPTELQEPEITPTPEVKELEEPETPQPTESPAPETQPQITPTPEVKELEQLETPQPTESPAPETQPEITPTPEVKELEEPKTPQPTESPAQEEPVEKYFPPQEPTIPVVPETTPIPEEEERAGEFKVTGYRQGI